ncbi:MAG: ABC transporter family substrate-binding protein [Ornithinimicrobium sp.]
MAIVAAGALALSACTSGGDSDDEGSGDEGGSGSEDSEDSESESDVIEKPDLGDVQTQDDQITYSLGEQEWDSWNDQTSATNSTYNAVVNAQTQGAFWYFGTDGSIIRDESFGTYEKTSDDPQTVEYTIADDAAWSDGTPITSNDFLLQWAASNPTTLFGEEEDAGLFDAISTSLGEQVPDGLDTEPDSKTFTVVYEDPYPDWEILLSAPLPAHIVAQEAGLEPAEMAQAILDKDPSGMEPVAEFYNTGWNASGGTLPDASLTPSSGPYTLEGATWNSPESLTLVPNEEYWSTPPGTKNLTFRFTAPEAMVQALQNGDINVIEPQPDVDTVQAIEGMGDGFTLLTGPTLTWEHLDFNFIDSSPFSEAEGGLAAREAFAMCVPRQQIVDNLIKPVDPEGTRMDLREVFPFQEEDYEAVLSEAYDGRYDEVDIEGATAKLEESGLSTPVDVRIGYSAPNQRRTNEVAEIKASCDQAGFNIVDEGDGAFFDAGGPLDVGDWDVALFAWAGSGQIASGESIYSTGEGQNFGKYSNEEVDAAWDTLAQSNDPEVWQEQRIEIEKLLWDDLMNIPLFPHPGLVGYDSSIENVFFNSTQTQISWNAEQWMRAQ